MLDLISDNIPHDFILNHMEGVNAAFLGAKRLTDDIAKCAEPERAYMLGQHRHWGLEQGFRHAAEQSGLKTLAPHTTPPVAVGTAWCVQGSCCWRARGL